MMARRPWRVFALGLLSLASLAATETATRQGGQTPQRTEPEARQDEAKRKGDDKARKDEERKEKERREKDRKAREEACQNKESFAFDAQTVPPGTDPCPTSAIDLAAGYTVLRYARADALPVGWSLAIAAKPTRFFGVVSELSGAYDTDDALPRGTRQSAIVFLNGPRAILPWSRVTVFAEALFGIAHDRDFRVGDADKNRFVWRPGGGVDIRLFTNVSVRFQAGRILNAAEKGSPKVYQFTSGLVFGK
jgi:hypothetical protein